MLATEGDSDKTATHTPSPQCVKGTGAGGWASNNRKPILKGVVG